MPIFEEYNYSWRLSLSYLFFVLSLLFYVKDKTLDLFTIFRIQGIGTKIPPPFLDLKLRYPLARPSFPVGGVSGSDKELLANTSLFLRAEGITYNLPIAGVSHRSNEFFEVCFRRVSRLINAERLIVIYNPCRMPIREHLHCCKRVEFNSFDPTKK